jgi:cysteine-rich repeat protein
MALALAVAAAPAAAQNVQITAPGEAYGHHGACSGWNGCTNAATCALWACQINGYANLVSYGASGPCTGFNNCNLFYDQHNVQCSWGNWCGVNGVTDIVCSNPTLPANGCQSPCGNGVLNAGEQCDDSNVANGDCCSSTCQYEASGASCTSDGLPCSSDVCNGTGTCTHNASPSGTPCRASAGICDVAETCDGASTSCPTDAFASSGECRPAADVCDAAESCDGSGPNCPPDGYLSSGECRAAAGVCDVAESCDGSGIACPADAKSTDPCRASADVCDVAESCDGINDDCPADGFALVGTPCRGDAGQCDVAEVCTGLGAACPADAKEPDGAGCNDGNTCTMTDTCQSGICTGADPLDCDDGDACTADSCDPMGGCVNDDAPASGCLTSAKSIVLIKDSSDDSKDKLLWKWIKGAALTQMDLGDPTASASYALCVYAGTTSALIADAALPPGPNWSAIGTKGYKFKGSSPDGLSLALLKGGAAGKSKALAKGKGATLPDPTLPLAYPVTVQLKKDGSPLCLESTFTSADEKKNTTTQFKAKQ